MLSGRIVDAETAAADDQQYWAIFELRVYVARGKAGLAERSLQLLSRLPETRFAKPTPSSHVYKTSAGIALVDQEAPLRR